jgi:NAD(P)-dependent dehydrogenase (short-subunit alcohol dehydrogenase family)
MVSSKEAQMKIKGSSALVTGASRGLGASLVRALQDAGCAKVYAGVRDIDHYKPPHGIIAVRLDVTNDDQIASVAEQCADVDLLINNAGVAGIVPFLAAPNLDEARREMETNYFGTLAMCRKFAAVLKRNGGGALVNVLSVASWIGVPMQGSYCASKAAAWSLTNAIRFELRSQQTLVAGVFVGYIDTDMTANLPYPKVSAAEVATRILEGIEGNQEEILADERSQTLRSELLGDYGPFNANMQKFWEAYTQR